MPRKIRELLAELERAGFVYWSDEDECFIGYAQIAGGNCCHGDTPEEVRRQLEVVMELCLEIENQDRETSEAATTRPH